MAFTEKEREKWNKLVGHFIEDQRPREEIRAQVDLSFSIEDQSIEIFEIRPHPNNPDEKIEPSVAKATWVRTQQIWKVYWLRADLKWHKYDPQPEVDSLKAFLDLVKEDAYACFWG